MEEGKSILSAARLRGKPAIELQRMAALESGDFFQEILPVMYDASIIDETRFLVLMKGRDVQSGLTTKELLELAIHWEVTPSASEFWKRHKSRDELVKALQRKKEAIDLAARMKASAPVSSISDADKGQKKTKTRRSSVINLSHLFHRGDRDVHGDLFGTHGEYTDGIIYMARRLKMDSASATHMAAQMQAVNEALDAAKLADNFAFLDQEGGDELFSGLDEQLRKATTMSGHPSPPLKARVPSPPKVTLEESVDSQPSNFELVEADPSAEASMEVDQNANSSVARVATMNPDESTIQIPDEGGLLHRIGSIRFSPDDYDRLAQVGGLYTVEPMQAHSRPLPTKEPLQTTVRRMVARGPSFHSDYKTERTEETKEGVIDMESFIAKHSCADIAEGDSEFNGGPLSSSRPHSRMSRDVEDITGRTEVTWGGLSPLGTQREGFLYHASSVTVAGIMDGVIAGAPEDGALPDKLSKLDLYYRPVRESEKVIVKLASPHVPSSQSRDVRSDDALDAFVARRSGASTPHETLKPGVGISTGRTPLSPGQESEKLALRHRLGGRAGAVARDISERLRGQLTTADIHLSPMENFEPRPRSSQQLSPRSRPSSSGRRRASTMRNVESNEPSPRSPRPPSKAKPHAPPRQVVESADSPVPSLMLPQDGFTDVLSGILDASRTKSNAASAKDALGRDVQYDGVVRQVARMRTGARGSAPGTPKDM